MIPVLTCTHSYHGSPMVTGTYSIDQLLEDYKDCELDNFNTIVQEPINGNYRNICLVKPYTSTKQKKLITKFKNQNTLKKQQKLRTQQGFQRWFTSITP